MYVLIETELGKDTVLGVFDSPDKVGLQLYKYYGVFQIEDYRDVGDSGVEWYQLISFEGGGDASLTLLEFTVNEL